MTGPDEVEFGRTLASRLKQDGFTAVREVEGEPFDIRRTLKESVDIGKHVDIIATTASTEAKLRPMLQLFPSLSDARVLYPLPYHWPTFLMTGNLINIANQIVVYALIAIGMTLIIITGGIDLSVGSLVALSAVVISVLVQKFGNGVQTSNAILLMCCLGAIAACGIVGAFTGAMITYFRIPPFIATLGMMQAASGVAYILAKGNSYADYPNSFTWLGRGASLWSIPNAVFLMVVIYLIAHVIMARTSLGRYIYAVGGNIEAARLSGVPVRKILMLVYIIGGVMAGLGGVIVASQLKSSSPQYGSMYELYVIAAVVVGGTSLSGGSGKIMGTLIGGLIIAVIANGMNLTKVESYEQKVVLGLVILGAVLLDMLRKHGRRIFTWN